MNRFGRIASCCTLAIAGWGISSCRESPENRYERRLLEAEGPALHAIHDEHLRELMADLGKLTDSAMPQELDLRGEREQRLGEIAYLAGRIADSARLIPEILANVELPSNYTEEFRAASEELETRARQLQSDASGLSTAELKRDYDQLIETCDRCHGKFRVLPAPASAPRSASHGRLDLSAGRIDEDLAEGPFLDRSVCGDDLAQ